MTDPAGLEATLREATERSLRYLSTLDERRVSPTAAEVRQLDSLDGPLPDSGTDPREVIRLLDELGSPATVASAGGRYFGFVIGSALPAALGANWLAGAWNQNPALFVMSPVAARLEEIALRWTRELLGLPSGSDGAFVTGDTMANFAGLAAARHAVLAQAGWDVEERGLGGAPTVNVVVGEEAHVSVLKAISMLGLGRGRVVRVPTDPQGRMRAEAMPRLSGPSIVCLQAGNVNSGAFDPFGEIIARTQEDGAWVHVDGAFGMWAAVAPSRRHWTEGVELADSWATDGHKWLNVPYDSGMVFVRNPEDLRRAMSAGPAAYLAPSDQREPSHFTPELSRRARGIETWAAIRSLGRSGIASMVERSCGFAARIADRLREAGYEVLNEVMLNQVLVAFGDDDTTARVITDLQTDGTCWCGGTRWHGRSAMRISLSSWATTNEDVERSLGAILRIARDAQPRR
ncbi:MAG TPA: aminotransferase class V-fold PLP-dependent enzyme [Thermoplasmata archaeon]|nr:aminotransferase class V-fold PLP-dependent enzyme [Thermoplasmata archaeon]